MKKLPLKKLLQHLYPETDEKSLYTAVMCGEIRINGETIRQIQRKVPEDAEVQWQKSPFVSRGGLKLKTALDAWNINVNGKIFLDAGASTGGFTDCLLRYGASYVYSVDVGYNQLHYSLRQDYRVGVLERTNINNLPVLDPQPDAAVADLSFRSLRGIVGNLLELTKEQWLIALIKPQFEYKYTQDPVSDEDFSGVLKPGKTYLRVLEELLHSLAAEGAGIEKAVPSMIAGRSGNREVLGYFSKMDTPSAEKLIPGVLEALDRQLT